MSRQEIKLNTGQKRHKLKQFFNQECDSDTD